MEFYEHAMICMVQGIEFSVDLFYHVVYFSLSSFLILLNPYAGFDH